MTRRPRRTPFVAEPTLTIPAPEFPEVTDPKKRAYLVGYIVGRTLDHAAAAAGVSVRTGLNWRTNPDDPIFLAAWAQAVALHGERMESCIWGRGMNGWDEPVYQGGKLVGTIHKQSDTLLIFGAKGALPGKYREHVEHSGPQGGAIPLTASVSLNLSQLTTAELAARAESLAQRLKEA